MKVSLNWVKEFTAVKLSVDDLVTKIGAQLGAVEEVIDLGKKYRGIIVVKVISCQKHPNADKLKVCIIDDDGKAATVKRDKDGYVQVVCGAPNVKENMLVAWLPPGTTVPSTVTKDALTLEAREIRGTVSNGMLASAKELDISDDHEGILELDPDDTKPGDDFGKIYGLDDYIIDIENKMFTHRPDLFGILGVSREIAGIEGSPFKSPQWYKANPEFPDIETEELRLEVRNELTELVPRFTAITMRGVSVAPSPLWLQMKLMKMGLRPINNIVDYTNYFMIESGQPIHIYDYDKVNALTKADHPIITVRHPAKGEKIKLLSGKTIELDADAMMVATDSTLICVGGAIGGSETEVDQNTTNIIVEAANWNMYTIRKTAMKHGIYTDAVTRFTKGQSPLQNPAVVARIVNEIRQSASGKVASGFIDVNNLETAVTKRQNLHPEIKVSVNFINARLGLKLHSDEIVSILRRVEFDVVNEGAKLSIRAPFWRTDIEIPEDIVEEVGRLYGYDHLPLVLPRRDLKPAPKDESIELKKQIRDILSAAGANEVLTYSFVHGNLLTRAGQKPEDSYQLSNALSPDLQYYRQTLTPSLLDKVHTNIKAGYDEFALYELNKTHNKIHGLDDEGVPGELSMVALTYAAKQSSKGSAYYQARKYLDHLADKFGFTLVYQEIKIDPGYPVTQPFDYRRSALVTIRESNVFLGIVGEYRNQVAKNFKLPLSSAGFEISLEAFLGAIVQSTESPYHELPRFPKTEQDISLKVPINLSYGELHDFIWEKITELKPPETLAAIRPVDIYQRDNDKDHKQVTLRLIIASYERTMTAEEVNGLLNEVAQAAKEKYRAERI